jgi:hypothetical protein
MRQFADIAVYGSDGNLALIVEVKKKVSTSTSWAAMMRRNLAAHGQFSEAPFFLLAVPDRFYFWKNQTSSLEPIEPDFVLEAEPILRPYIEKAGFEANRLTENSLELIIASWLSEIVQGEAQDSSVPNNNWLWKSGFINALHGGRVKLEYAV